MELLEPESLGLYRCALAGWGHTCGEGWHRHHILSRAKLRSNPEAWEYCDKIHEEIFTEMVCGVANASLKLADTKFAQAIILQDIKIPAFGYEYVLEVWNNVPGKIAYPTLDAILAHYPQRSLAIRSRCT